MTVVNLREAQQILGFKTPFTLRKAIKDGHLGAYLRSGPDRRCIYLELTPAGLPTLREQIQRHVAFHGNSPLWNRDSDSTVSDEALDEAMGPINEWIEGREADSWEARAAAFIDPSCWSAPPWSPQEWRNLKAIIQLAEDS